LFDIDIRVAVVAGRAYPAYAQAIDDVTQEVMLRSHLLEAIFRSKRSLLTLVKARPGPEALARNHPPLLARNGPRVTG